MYDESTPVINPDPTKYALSENGIERLPRQCCGCKSLFTPVNDDQKYCEYCAPDPVVVPVEYTRQVKIQSKINQTGFVRTTPEYAYHYKMCKGKARSRMNHAADEDKEKWVEVHETIRRLYHAREQINYDEIVNSVFGVK